MRQESASFSDDASADLSGVTHTDSDENSKESEVLDPQIKRARQIIASSKATLFVVFLVALLALSSAVYTYVRKQEQNAFESDVSGYGVDIIRWDLQIQLKPYRSDSCCA